MLDPELSNKKNQTARLDTEWRKVAAQFLVDKGLIPSFRSLRLISGKI